MSIIPSTTATITVGNVGTTLGNATKNMGGFRGFGGSVPSSGALSMSQCQKIQNGVGYYNSWQVNPAGTNRGSWSSTSITNNSSITCSIWFKSGALFGNWRNLFHSGVNPFADFPRNPSFYIQAGGSQILWTSNWASGENSGYYSSISHNGIGYNLIAVFNGTSLTMYLNGGSAVTVAINTPNNAPNTNVVWSPDTLYPMNTSSTSLNYLWFFPYPMTAAQVSTYYNSLQPTLAPGLANTSLRSNLSELRVTLEQPRPSVQVLSHLRVHLLSLSIGEVEPSTLGRVDFQPNSKLHGPAITTGHVFLISAAGTPAIKICF